MENSYGSGSDSINNGTDSNASTVMATALSGSADVNWAHQYAAWMHMCQASGWNGFTQEQQMALYAYMAMYANGMAAMGGNPEEMANENKGNEGKAQSSDSVSNNNNIANPNPNTSVVDNNSNPTMNPMANSSTNPTDSQQNSADMKYNYDENTMAFNAQMLYQQYLAYAYVQAQAQAEAMAASMSTSQSSNGNPHNSASGMVTMANTVPPLEASPSAVPLSATNGSRRRNKPNLSAPNGVVRCICGDYLEKGVMIQCDACTVWQHAKCIGVSESDQVDKDYACELCLPEHPIHIARQNRDEATNPTQKKARKKTRTKKEKVKEKVKEEKKEKPDIKRKKRKRSAPEKKGKGSKNEEESSTESYDSHYRSDGDEELFGPGKRIRRRERKAKNSNSGSESMSNNSSNNNSDSDIQSPTLPRLSLPQSSSLSEWRTSEGMHEISDMAMSRHMSESERDAMDAIMAISPAHTPKLNTPASLVLNHSSGLTPSSTLFSSSRSSRFNFLYDPSLSSPHNSTLNSLTSHSLLSPLPSLRSPANHHRSPLGRLCVSSPSSSFSTSSSTGDRKIERLIETIEKLEKRSPATPSARSSRNSSRAHSPIRTEVPLFHSPSTPRDDSTTTAPIIASS